MRHWLFFGLLATLMGVVGASSSASALSLQVQPLHIKTTIGKSERQKGYLDIANSGAEALTVETSVQAFRQINDKGDLQFFDNEKVAAGILLDETTISLEPHETFRMYYVLDGTKLPAGDISAAIFFTTTSGEVSGVTPEVRVGTLLSIVNGKAGARQAELTKLSVPFFQLEGKVKGTYSIKNTSDSRGGGFFPDVQVQLSPLDQSTTVESSLVFPGVERQNQFSMSTNRFGFYYVEAQFGSSKRGAWVFVASLWQLIVICVVALTIMGYGFRHRLRRVLKRSH